MCVHKVLACDIYIIVFVVFLQYQQEVVAALPKFVKLSPTLVKGVLDRLLVSYKGEFDTMNYYC